MLTELHIRHLAIIEDLVVSFSPGFNVLTGETGAGKTMLVVALDLLRGARADADLVRHGCAEASVTGIFEIAGKQEPLIIRRTVSAEGKSRATLDGEPVPLQTLKELQGSLFDIASQHEQQRLMDTASHCDLLDQWGGLAPLQKNYAESFARWKQALSRLSELEARQQRVEQQQEWIRFQYDELQKADLKEGEEENLQGQRDRARHAAQLHEAVGQAQELLAPAAMAQSRKILEKAAGLDSTLSPLTALIEQAQVHLEEVSRTLADYENRLEEAPADIEAIESRLALIEQLKRKYHATQISELIARQETFAAELDAAGHFEEQSAQIRVEAEAAHSEMRVREKKLTDQRKKSAELLAKKVEKELSDLAMSQTQFFVRSEELPEESWSEKGSCSIEFLIAPNVGEPLKGLVRIASGGELSRLLLALKSALIGKTALAETFIFDEIDTGIGGAVAFAIGRKMAALAQKHQVVCITHLPQVASQASHHLSICKKVEKGRTITCIETLPEARRKEEIARMLGGEEMLKSLR